MMAMEVQLALYLLDELWFFHNTLIPKAKEANVKCPDGESEIVNSSVPLRGAGTQALLRMPTLPPRLERLNTALDEEVRSLKGCNPKLRHSLSSLDHYRPNSSSKSAERPPRYVKLERSERYLAIQHYINKEAYYRKIFKEKKWRSLSDLEYIEVQGFKDLGFIPDQRSAKKSAPPIFRHVDKKSAEDMKEQLKFWARAVACNARKES